MHIYTSFLCDTLLNTYQLLPALGAFTGGDLQGGIFVGVVLPKNKNIISQRPSTFSHLYTTSRLLLRISTPFLEILEFEPLSLFSCPEFGNTGVFVFCLVSSICVLSCLVYLCFVLSRVFVFCLVSCVCVLSCLVCLCFVLPYPELEILECFFSVDHFAPLCQMPDARCQKFSNLSALKTKSKKKNDLFSV